MEENNVIEPLQDDALLDGEQDEWQHDGTSDYEPSLAESTFVSVTPTVAAHIWEHGRRYHRFKAGQYPLPNDDEEHNRESLRHEMLKELLDGKFYLAPISDSPQKIIDLGTGFGDWAIDVAQKFPSAQVIGVDLSPVQPDWVSPNIQFRVDDIEDEWRHGGNFDLAHLQFTGNMLADHNKLVANVFENLKPGGWFETVDVYPKPFSDDGTIPDNYPPREVYQFVAQNLRERKGFDLCWIESLRLRLQRAGFINIERKVYSIPVGDWPRDKKLRMLGIYWRGIIAGFFHAVAGKTFTEAGMDAAVTEKLLDAATKAMNDRRVHAIVPVHFVWAQKPLAS